MPEPSEVRVPRIIGLLVGEAERELLSAGLRPVTVWDYGPGQDALSMGYVFDQNPAAGNRVPEGSIVRIHSWFETEREPEAWEQRVGGYADPADFPYHVFICHAHEDRDVASEIAAALTSQGAKVWFDKYELRVGDSIRQKIDEGLRKSRFGVVLISRNFFAKGWANYELDGLLQRHMVATGQGGKVLLPVWVDVDYQDVVAQSPSLAGFYAARLADGMERVVDGLFWAMGNPVVDAGDRLTKEQEVQLVEVTRTFVRHNARDGLEFQLDDFRYASDPRGGWWATCWARSPAIDDAMVVMYMSPDSGWFGIDIGSGLMLQDYPLPGPLMPRWW